MRRQSGIVWVVAIVLGLGLSACAKGSTGPAVRPGSTVTLEYSLAADNVPVVPDNATQLMKLTVGAGKLPALFEKNLIGLSAGAAKKIKLKPEEAFGPMRKELIGRIARASLPAGELTEGMMLHAGPATMRVAKILEDGTVVIDRNHPLAGKHLLYKVRIKSVE